MPTFAPVSSSGILYALASAPSQPVQIDLIRDLQTAFGLRVSEALAIRAEDIGEDDSVFIRAAKGSTSRTEHNAALAARLRALRGAQLTGEVFTVSYRQVYLADLRDANGYQPSGATNRRITHSRRAEYMQARAAEGLSVEEIAADVGLVNPAVVYTYLDGTAPGPSPTPSEPITPLPVPLPLDGSKFRIALTIEVPAALALSAAPGAAALAVPLPSPLHLSAASGLYPLGLPLPFELAQPEPPAAPPPPLAPLPVPLPLDGTRQRNALTVELPAALALSAAPDAAALAVASPAPSTFSTAPGLASLAPPLPSTFTAP